VKPSLAEVKPSLKAVGIAKILQQKGIMRIAGSEGFTQACRSETLTKNRGNSKNTSIKGYHEDCT